MPHRLYSIWLGSQDADFGSITFGAVESPGDKYTGELIPTPIILSGPLFTGWQVTLAALSRTTTKDNSYPQTELLLPANETLPVVVDSGSPNMYIPISLFDRIAAPYALAYYTNPEGNPTPYVPCALRTLISPSTYFTFGFVDGAEIRVPLHETIYPFGLPENMGEVVGDDGTQLCYLGIVPTAGNIFLLGTTFLRSAYAVFSGDEGKWTLSLAQAKYPS